MLDVWESKEQLKAAKKAVVDPALAQVFGVRPPLGPPPVIEAFEVRGLVIPAVDVFS